MGIIMVDKPTYNWGAPSCMEKHHVLWVNQLFLSISMTTMFNSYISWQMGYTPIGFFLGKLSYFTHLNELRP